jgi:hypothetical protein
MSKSKPRKVIITFPSDKVNERDYAVVLDRADLVKARIENTEGLTPAEQNKYNWIASIFQTLNFTHEQRHVNLKGTSIGVQFTEAFEGGGLAWLEPFLESAEPTNAPPNGYFLSARGTPAILSAEWREYAEDNNGKIITRGSKKFGQRVQLHIYTKALYGHELKVYLKDHDRFLLDSDDDLPQYETKEGKPVIKATYFNAKVKVYEALPDEPKGNALKNGNGKDKVPVQKAIVNIFLDDAWIDKAGNHLQVYSFITAPNVDSVEKELKDKYLEVKDKANPAESRNESNKPVLVGDIPTSAADFHPCKYTAVKAVVSMKNNKTGKDEDKTVWLYKEKEVPFRNFEIVAGMKNGVQKVTIALDNLSVKEEDCRQRAGEKHREHVLALKGWPEDKIKKTPPGKEKKPAENKWSIAVKQDASLVKTKASSTNAVSKDDIGLEILESKDDKLVFNARYMYNLAPFDMLGAGVHPIFRYFWLGGKYTAGRPYVIAANTCRHAHEFNVVTYPDVKWKLALEYNNNKSGITVVDNSRYRNPPKSKWIKVGDKEVALSLEAEWDGEEKLNLTEDFTEKIKKTLDKFGRIGAYIERVFLGKENNASGNAQPAANHQQTMEEARKKFEEEGAKRDKEEKEAEKMRDYFRQKREQMKGLSPDSKEYRDLEKDVNTLQRRLDRKFSGLKRQVVGLEVIWPSLSLSFGWSRVDTGLDQLDEYKNRTGVLLEGTLEAKPLIGLSAYLDFLGLLQRAHPVALAIIAAADLSMRLIGDGSRITCELRATGQLGGKLQGFLNTLTHENSFNKTDRANNNRQVSQITGDLAFSLKVELKLVVKKHFIGVTVTGQGSVNAEATAKWSARAVIDADEQGYYAKFFGTFEGLDIVAKAEASFKAEDGDAESLFSHNSSATVKYKAIDKQPEKELGILRFDNKS